ncbi:hypothetical protein PMZ80_000563 [Knufia obscura]|uniref:Uncharacterized protein n=1 Tax=Knufia obscura TaxID=1635080 RepID=A0ABR0S0R3_9EURO|nr:hypothetical protein PMZ80_000563 [Knufia obscura]
MAFNTQYGYTSHMNFLAEASQQTQWQQQQVPQHWPAVQAQSFAGAYQYAPQSHMGMPQGYAHAQVSFTQGTSQHPGLPVNAGMPALSQQWLQVQQEQARAAASRARARARALARPAPARAPAAVPQQQPSFTEMLMDGGLLDFLQSDAPVVPAGPKDQDVVSHDMNMRAGSPPAPQQQQAPQEPIQIDLASDDEDEVRIIEAPVSSASVPEQQKNQESAAQTPSAASLSPPQFQNSEDAKQTFAAMKKRYKGKLLRVAAQAQQVSVLAKTSLNDQGWAGKELRNNKAAEYLQQQGAYHVPAPVPMTQPEREEWNAMLDRALDMAGPSSTQAKSPKTPETPVADVPESGSATSSGSQEAVAPKSAVAEKTTAEKTPAPLADYGEMFLEDDDEGENVELEIINDAPTGSTSAGEMDLGEAKTAQPMAEKKAELAAAVSAPTPTAISSEPKKRGRAKGTKNRPKEEIEAEKAQKQAAREARERAKQEKAASASKPASKKRKAADTEDAAASEPEPAAKKARKQAKPKPEVVYKNDAERQRAEAKARMAEKKAAFRSEQLVSSRDGSPAVEEGPVIPALTAEEEAELDDLFDDDSSDEEEIIEEDILSAEDAAKYGAMFEEDESTQEAPVSSSSEDMSAEEAAEIEAMFAEEAAAQAETADSDSLFGDECGEDAIMAYESESEISEEE